MFGGDEVVRNLEAQLENAAKRIQALVISQPPKDLLGYLWSKFLSEAIPAQMESEDKKPDSDVLQRFQFILEYVHAVWSSHAGIFTTGAMRESEVQELIRTCEEMRGNLMMHCMATTASSTHADFGEATKDIEFHAKSSWLLMRGRRYQVLEEEFFDFVLAPHNNALIDAYGMGSSGIARGIQSVADSLREGHGTAIQRLSDHMGQLRMLQLENGLSFESAIEAVRDAAGDSEIRGLYDDLFRGGICNLSRHTKFSDNLLEDLSYMPGTETSFFAEGPLAGTPYRTLPARVKPLVRLDDGYYATDGQFVRDSAYRAIQRGLIKRNAKYREDWNQNQKKLIESALPRILNIQLRNSEVFSEVYFKDVVTGAWVETDLVVIVDDLLIVVEAKAGVMAMHSPATDFDRHVRTIRELVLKGYSQCRRFIEYINSKTVAPIYKLSKGRYEQIATLKYDAFRRIFPIGLTVESFSPFSSMCKDIPEVASILGRHSFISMSVDDLFVLNRFLPTTGELLHYLEVRQEVAGLPKVIIYDEIDHLGAYISRNRFDQDIKAQLKEADFIAWDSFCDVIDRFFERENWQTDPVPQQSFPVELRKIIEALDRFRPSGWLRLDAILRDFGGHAREEFASLLRKLTPTLRSFPFRRFLFGGDRSVQI